MGYRKISVIILTLLFTSCKLTNEDIINHSWKYGEGFHIGDWLEFNNNTLELKKDTVFRNKIPIATIVNTIKPVFANNNKIVIRSILTLEKGTYHQK